MFSCFLPIAMDTQFPMGDTLQFVQMSSTWVLLTSKTFGPQVLIHQQDLAMAAFSFDWHGIATGPTMWVKVVSGCDGELIRFTPDNTSLIKHAIGSLEANQGKTWIEIIVGRSYCHIICWCRNHAHGWSRYRFLWRTNRFLQWRPRFAIGIKRHSTEFNALLRDVPG